jgi:hypothetical protein
MKRTAFSLFVLAVLTGISCQNTGSESGSDKIADTANYTRIQWLDSMVNFGTIPMGQQVKVVFRFRNAGNKPLFLTNVRAGCGCTVPDYTKGAIIPGGEGEVSGAFDSNKSHTGQVRKNIFVTANTKGETLHTLTFTGIITEKITVK